MNNLWFAGVPGSRWSGIHRLLVNACDNVDRTDENDDRRFFHKNANPHNPLNGHSGAYWGPGMGCGEHWTKLQKLGTEQIQKDIRSVFTGTGTRIIKNHFLLRHYNLDWIAENFSSDFIFLVYREPQKSFAWWCEVMDFTEEHWPDYRPGYKDYNTMYERIRYENAYMLDFAIRNNMAWKPASDVNSFTELPNFNADKYSNSGKWNDVYITYQRIT